MSLRVSLLLIFLFSHSLVMAQHFSDSVELEEVKIYGIPMKEYSVGSKIYKIDSADLELNKSSNVAELLTETSSLYFKTYGTGIATVSFRGTSSSHTAVLWNGVNINSASLGQSDFSIFPVIAAENVSLHFGSSSALYGSGAIGGSIHLYSTPDWISGFQGSIYQDIGSFHKFHTSLSTTYGDGSFEGKTNIYFKTAENDFPYELKGIDGIKEVRQENAAIKQYGLSQDFNYRIASNQYIAVNFWLNQLDREVQPSISSSSNQDQQLDQNIRIVANYHLNGKFGHLNPRMAYLYDLLEFNKSPSHTYRYIAAVQHEYKINKALKISGGVDYTHIIADVNGYGGRINEDRMDLFTLIRYSPWKKFLLSANIRQSFVTGFRAPVSPSFGFEYNFISSEDYNLYWKSNASRSYRVPTLNDRYWSPGGNPDIKSETGMNYETGVQLIKENSLSKIEFELTGYTNFVEDWIIWLPKASHWSPQNINKVHARGIEIRALYENVYGAFLYSFGLNYAFTKSTHDTRENNDYGEQLMYVPLHNGSLQFEGKWKKWFLRLNNTYTGSRFTTIEKLDPYWLMRITLGKSIPLGGQSLSAFVKINNIFNREYFNYESRAMPGRNYNLSIKYTFNNN